MDRIYRIIQFVALHFRLWQMMNLSKVSDVLAITVSINST